MRKTLPLALATALLMSSMSSALSADLIGGAGTASYTPRHTEPLRHARPHREKAWQPPRNMHVVVSARYCEDTACDTWPGRTDYRGTALLRCQYSLTQGSTIT